MSVFIEPGFTGNDEPINNPRICYAKHDVALTVSASAPGFNKDWLLDGETWNFWRGNQTTQFIRMTFTDATTGYAAIAAHNLGTTGASITCQVNGVTVAGGVQPQDDSDIVFLFDNRTANDVLLFVFNGTANPEIAVVQTGPVLEMPRKSVYTGLPISESKQVRYRHQQSIRGDVLGRAVEGAELAFDMTVQNLPETFRTSTADVSWKGFLNHVDNVGPFFIAAKPQKYPDDVAYAQATERPRFNRETPNSRLSGAVTFQCKGYAKP